MVKLLVFSHGNDPPMIIGGVFPKILDDQKPEKPNVLTMVYMYHHGAAERCKVGFF
jgi:hypothetical protein